MRKIVKVYICIFILVFIISACSKKADDNVGEQTSFESTVEVLSPESVLAMTKDEMSEVRNSLLSIEFSKLLPKEKFNLIMLDYYLDWDSRRVKPSLHSSAYKWYPFNQEIEYDLNGDGKPDKIIITLSDSGVMLKINDVEMDCLYSSENTVDGFAIINIDYADNYKEIVISDTGYSSDFTSRFYGYDGKKIIYMNEGASISRPVPEDAKEWVVSDKIEGLFTNMEIGNGGITTLQRATTLQTWWYPLRYELTDGHLLQAVAEIFEVDYEVFVLSDMPLYSEKSETSSTIDMRKGTLAKITALDDIEWIQIRLDDGQKGWFKIKSHDVIVVKDNEIKASDVFFYLYSAD